MGAEEFKAAPVSSRYVKPWEPSYYAVIKPNLYSAVPSSSRHFGAIPRVEPINGNFAELIFRSPAFNKPFTHVVVRPTKVMLLNQGVNWVQFLNKGTILELAEQVKPLLREHKKGAMISSGGMISSRGLPGGPTADVPLTAGQKNIIKYFHGRMAAGS